MGDVVMVLVVLAFFVVCIGYVTWCGRIIGPDPDVVEPVDEAAAAADPADRADLATAGRP